MQKEQDPVAVTALLCMVYTCPDVYALQQCNRQPGWGSGRPGRRIRPVINTLN